MRNLLARPWRFNELKKDLEGISQKVLTDSLRSMEDDGIITRTVLGRFSETEISFRFSISNNYRIISKKKRHLTVFNIAKCLYFSVFSANLPFPLCHIFPQGNTNPDKSQAIYTFLRVKHAPTIDPTKTSGAILTNSHSDA